MAGKRRGESGYLLMEAMVAVLILSIGIVSLVQTSRKAVRVAHLRERCYGPARQYADAILAQLELASVQGTPAPLLDGGKGAFACTIERSTWQNIATLQQVTVTVNWTEGDRAGSVTLTTLLPLPVAEEADKSPRGSEEKQDDPNTFHR